MFRRELARSGLPKVDASAAVDLGPRSAVLLGAKLLWVAEHLGETPFTRLCCSAGAASAGSEASLAAWGPDCS